ncbi:MAG: HD domain-containing protein, partial [Lachnospiraceae bacterium]|nr:HD domain-containing protein [Lachnospiraceae bacterium]
MHFVEVDANKFVIGKQYEFDIVDLERNILYTRGKVLGERDALLLKRYSETRGIIGVMTEGAGKDSNYAKIAELAKVKGGPAIKTQSDISPEGILDKKIAQFEEVKIKDIDVERRINMAMDVGKRINEANKASEDRIKKYEYKEASEELLRTIRKEINFGGEKNIISAVEELNKGYDTTYLHSKNVATMMMTVIRYIKRYGIDSIGNEKIGTITDEHAEHIFMGALAHDLGKLELRELVEFKGIFSPEQREMIKKHTLIGGRILKDLDADPDTIMMALSHHEEGDGSGYPNGLDWTKVPWYARLLHIVDVYDALTAERAYKPPMLPTSLLDSELTVCCYTDGLTVTGDCVQKFDSRLVELFLRAVPMYPVGTHVFVSSGTKPGDTNCWGIVTENNEHAGAYPKVMLDDGQTVIDLSNTKWSN